MATRITKDEIKEIQDKAEAGDAEAQNKLGDFYYDGIDGVIEKDHATACIWFTKAAEQGQVDGLYSMGWAYLTGEGVERDFAAAAGWLVQAAEKKHPKAMRHLARLHFMGQGVEKDAEKACKLLEEAVELKDFESASLLGKLYMEGIPDQIPKDQKKGFQYLVKAAEAGDPESMHLIATAYEGGHGVEKSEEKAHIWRRMAEQAGFHSPDTIFKIAIAHFQGTDRVPRDVGKAAMLFKKAADMGHPVAAYNLSRFFYYGTGVQQNYIQAYDWAIKAVKLGEMDAGMLVGQCCEFGHGTIPDHQLALQWYLYALNGMEDEKIKTRIYFYMGRCYYKGGHHDGIPSQIQPDYAKAVYWTQRSIDEGQIGEAYNLMGDLYFRGHGVERSVAKAKEMWKKAADAGVESAQEALHALENYSLKERFMVYVPSIIMFVLFFAVVGYFVWKYKEMASESWFQKIQEIKLNDNDRGEDPPKGDPSAPE